MGFAADLIPIGLEYIAAAIEDLVDEVHIIDMDLEDASIQSFLDDYQPELVCISMSATDHNEGLRIAKIAKENGCTTVLGGYHPTAIPDKLLAWPQVDLVVRGEGEDTMKELIQKASPRDVLGLSYKGAGGIMHNGSRPLIQDLDALPFPARHLRRHQYHDHVTIHGGGERDVISMSRGCWGRCDFCCEPMMSRGRQRFRSPENVMKELLEIVSFHEGRPLHIFVTDPNFLGSPQRVDHLCDLLRQHELDIKFTVLVRVDSVVRNPALIKKMCENGICIYEMGIESPRAEDLINVNKGITLEMQEKAVQILRANGAWAGGTFVIGLPNQTEEEIKQFPLYAKQIGLTGAAFGITTPFPGTKLYQELTQEGLIVEHDWTKYDEMHSVYKLKHVSAEQLEELATYCHAKFWTLDTFIEQTRLSLKPEEKVPLQEFIKEMLVTLRFAWNTASDLQPEKMLTHMRIAAETIADPCVEAYTKKVGIHNIIDFPKSLLTVLGSQKIQFTLTENGAPITSYIIKTTKNTVEYVKAVSGRQDDATINLDADLENVNLSGHNNTLKLLKNFVGATVSLRGLEETWSRLRLLTAIGLESTRLITSQTDKVLDKIKRHPMPGWFK